MYGLDEMSKPPQLCYERMPGLEGVDVTSPCRRFIREMVAAWEIISRCLNRFHQRVDLQRQTFVEASVHDFFLQLKFGHHSGLMTPADVLTAK